MKKHLATFALAILMGALGFAVSGVAVAGNGKPPSPPGQDECEHGNAAKPCKDDPQPDKGKDCEEHGNQGGVNEDHCKGQDTTPTETTPSDTPPTNGGNNPYTPPATVPDEPSSTQPTEPISSESSEPAPMILGTPPVATSAKKQAATLGMTANAPKPTRQAQQAPVTL